MRIKKAVINGVEYNLLTGEEIEEIFLLAKIQAEGNRDRLHVNENYMSKEEFFRRLDEKYGA